MPKTNAEMCREYRQKKKEKRIKKVPKSSTERVREFRARRKALLNVQHNSENAHHDSQVDVLNVQGDTSIGHNIENNGSRICEIHITSDCFKRNLKTELSNLPEKRKLLEEDALPSLNLRKTLKIDHQRTERCTRQEQKALVNEIIVTSDMENFTEEIVIKEEPIIWDDAAVKQEHDLSANLNYVKSEERFDEKSSSIDPLKQANDIEQVWIKTESIDNVKNYSCSLCEFKTNHKESIMKHSQAHFCTNWLYCDT